MRNSENPLGVRVTTYYPWDKPPSSCYTIEKPDEKVSTILDNAFQKWCYVQPVMIAAPTGSGKTSLVIQIARYCHRASPDKWVMLLVNRTAIAVQQMQHFASELGSKWAKITDPEVFELFEILEDVHVIITTYQGFSAHRDRFPLNKVAWVIFDEAHVFHADSLFNPYLDQLFWNLPKLFSRANRLYLSATPDSVIHDICDAEGQNLSACAACPYSSCQGKGKLLLYKFPAHFQSLSLCYYREPIELVKLVQQHPKDQFLLFTAKRESLNFIRENSYMKQFRDANISCAYLDSDRKDTPLWKQVCRDGTFEEQVLIATSVLDCGVNLVSPRLRHIIVETTDQTEFLQMIGRRRLAAHENLTVYIRAYNRRAVQNRLNSVEKQLGFISRASKTIQKGGNEAVLYRGWMDEDPTRPYLHLLNCSGTGKILPKRTAQHYLIWQQVHLKRLLECFDLHGDDSALPRAAHIWLNQGGSYSPARWLDYDSKSTARKDLLSMVDANKGKPLNKAEYQALAKELLSRINDIQAFAHDTNERINRTPTTMNKRFEHLQIPYKFHQEGRGKGAVYILVRAKEA